MKNQVIKKRELVDVLIMIPFFEPFSISMLGANSRFWEWIGYLFAIARYAISFCGICIFIKSRSKKGSSAIIVFCLVFVLFLMLSSFLNRSIYITFFLSGFTYLGFLLLLKFKCYKYSGGYLLFVLSEMFFVYFVLGILTIFLMPNGFNNALVKAEAIYFLGSKNSSFYYFFGFLSCYSLRYFIDCKKPPIICDLFFILSLIASYMCDSINSMGSLFLLFFFYEIVKYSNRLYKLLQPGFFLLLVIAIAIILMFGRSFSLFNVIFRFLGRDGSLTGRDYIWEQQLLLLKENLLWGNGIHTITVLKSNAVATHAHNFYLDVLVKYGVVSFGTMLILVYKATNNIAQMRRNRYRSMIAVVLFVLLLHNVFDDVSLYLLFMVMYFTEIIPSFMLNNERIEGIYNGFTR